MSFYTENNRVFVTDSGGETVFDTDRRMLYIHSKVTASFTITNTSSTSRDHLVATLPRPADFILGRIINLSNGRGFDANGSFVDSVLLNYGFAYVRILTPVVNGSNIFIQERVLGGHPSRNFTAVFYAGNYDL